MHYCRGCSTEKPESEFYTAKGKLKVPCKSCCSAAYKVKYQNKKNIAPTLSVTEKMCSECKLTKKAEDFFVRKASPDGLAPRCKPCKSENDKKYYKKNAQRIVARVTEYQVRNREAVNSWRRGYTKDKIANDVQFRLRRIMRRRLRDALLHQSAHKAASALVHVGCSVDELRHHIESKFQEGMSWDNYGTLWHIDHIKPLSKFDLTQPEQQAAACHYTNLQPLWKKQNLTKGARYSEDNSQVLAVVDKTQET